MIWSAPLQKRSTETSTCVVTPVLSCISYKSSPFSCGTVTRRKTRCQVTDYVDYGSCEGTQAVSGLWWLRHMNHMHNHEYLGSISGALVDHLIVFGSNVISVRKKHKAQVELLQLIIPSEPKKTESPGTKLEQSHERNTDPLLIVWILIWEKIPTTIQSHIHCRV